MFFQRFPRRAALDPRCIEYAIRDAIREDHLGHGITVDNASLAAELDRVRANGRPLPGWLAGLMGRRLRRDFGEVRIHAGERVDRLTARFRAAAFCVGSDIFLDRCVLRAGCPAFTLDALCHELAHIANAVEPGRIRCWDRDSHEALTVAACEVFSAEFKELVKIKELHLSQKELVEGLKIACSNMDFRKRASIDSARYFPDFLASWVAVNVFHSGFHLTDVPIIGPLIAKGEGPRHGEGLNYTRFQPDINIEANVKAQQNEIKDAAKNFAFDKAHDFDDWLPTKRALFGWALTLNEKEWIKSLGNALHIAQDRASHREGRKNFGHSDPRVLTGWSPDDPDNDDHRAHDCEVGHSWWICNKAALAKAFNNSCEVIEAFLREIGIQKIHRWVRRSEIHGGAGWQTLRDLLDAPPEGCVHGRRPGPIGLE